MCDSRRGWVCVGKRAQITADVPLAVDNGETGVGIYKVDDKLYAIEDTCPHAYAHLSEGFVLDGKVECPLHAAVFDIRTGELLEGPGERNLETYPVEIRGDEVYVQIQTLVRREKL
jgi:3-phenylpropionate/trans-cinnamate dioxygenase ferredoxin component